MHCILGCLNRASIDLAIRLSQCTPPRTVRTGCPQNRGSVCRASRGGLPQEVLGRGISAFLPTTPLRGCVLYPVPWWSMSGARKVGWWDCSRWSHRDRKLSWCSGLPERALSPAKGLERPPEPAAAADPPRRQRQKAARGGPRWKIEAVRSWVSSDPFTRAQGFQTDTPTQRSLFWQVD